MKEVLATWIVIQLLVIGLTGGMNVNEQLTDCQILSSGGVPKHDNELTSPSFGVNIATIVLPLVLFVPDGEMDCLKTTTSTSKAL